MLLRVFCAGLCLLTAGMAKEPGLLFYLSGDHGTTADYAAGEKEPNFANDEVKVMPGGAHGPYLQCGNLEMLSYWAPGNIYAERGTLSFYWRSREAVGKTEFPVFRVGYADHSSWDMVWLRIDYNGKPGFDAFVTDVNLGRTRVSYAMPSFPKPDEWVHLALTWDENKGIRFYVNGKLAGEKAATGMFNAGLDQFGPHARAINPMQVHSAYNFDRGGDIDEIRIYDRMLSDENIAGLARNETPTQIPALNRDLQAQQWRDEWWYRNGWNRAGDIPAPLTSPHTTVRKVEIHDVYDLKRWWWKATDGIRETTWPGVFNRSRLVGRNDYFQLPDWDCYSLSGKTVTFFMPEEPWNHIEISGGAWGPMTLLSFNNEKQANTEQGLFERPKGQEKTVHQFAEPVVGQKIRFTNIEQETPIGELSAYYVHEGKEPAGIARLTYKLSGKQDLDNPSLTPLAEFINGRNAPDERQTMVAMPAGAPKSTRKTAQSGLPIVHILVPNDFRDLPVNKSHGAYSYTWDNMAAGLDGIAIDLPALNLPATHGAYIPLNIQVKDPLWPMRDMLDFSFSVKPGEPHTLWLDTRDRILPNGKSLYLTISAASPGFGPAALEGAELRLVFKPWKEAAKEHEIDRFTQVRDNYANMVEEHTNTRKLHIFARFEADMSDLLRVNPDHKLGRLYWYDDNKESAKPAFQQPAAPSGVPLWAFRQVEDLRYVKRFVNWYIDHRQIENGEFGGGLSDDGDLTNWWPGTALMGSTPEKIRRSLVRELDAFYAEGMFTNGLSTIQADELHSYEEGIQALGQALTLDYASPKQLERAMETTRRLQWLTGVNEAGHRHIRSSYFNGAKMSEESVWGWSKPSSYLVMHPAMALAQFNGSPAARELVIGLADGLLAHRKPGKNGKSVIRAQIEFKSDKDEETGGVDRAWFMLWAAYKLSGEQKYLDALLDEGPAVVKQITGNVLDQANLRPTWGKQMLAAAKGGSTDYASLHVAYQMSGEPRFLETLYGNQIESSALREYINTEGSLWIDRVMVDYTELQRARLGGVALIRNSIYPGHVVSWNFAAPATDESVAVVVPESTPEHVKITAYNLDDAPVQARMTGWDILPGQWELVQDGGAPQRVNWERAASLPITFAPHRTTTLELKRVAPGTPYWQRFDLGIGEDDVKLDGRRVKVTVHSLGAVDAPASRVVLRDAAGQELASAAAPGLKAPVDLLPKTAAVSLAVPGGAQLKGASVTIESKDDPPEITLMNNTVRLP